MKKLFLSLVLAATAITANATVITVNNGSVTAGQYTTIQPAVDAAKAGDTIYVHGSVTTYGDVTLNKRVVLLGAGHHLTGTQYNLSSKLSYIYLSQGNSTTLPTGSIIKGFDFGNLGSSGGSLLINNITIERNYFSYLSVYGSGWIIKNNVGSYIACTENKNLIISNNVLVNVATSSQPSVIITNNIFRSGCYINSVSYANIANNIFIEPGQNYGITSNGSQNTWNKNIMIYADPANFKTFPPAGNTGVGNLNTIDDQFTDVIPLNVTSNDVPNYNWNLLTTSLGYKYGTDGTDNGIFGGSYPMPDLTGATNIPQMTSMDILNSVIPQNGTLTIELKARGQQ
jgi:hypothetical protein